jgi:hypothetical protein
MVGAREPVAVDVNGLNGAGDGDQKQAGESQRPQPDGMRAGIRSTLKASVHDIFR